MFPLRTLSVLMSGDQYASLPTPVTTSVWTSCIVFPVLNPPAALGSVKTKMVTDPSPTEYWQFGLGELRTFASLTSCPKTVPTSSFVKSEQGSMELTVSADFVFVGGDGLSVQATKQIAKVVRKRIFIMCTINSFGP